MTGLTGVVSDKDLARILGSIDDPQLAAVELKDMALDNDSKDNVTCLIIHAVAQQDADRRGRLTVIALMDRGTGLVDASTHERGVCFMLRLDDFTANVVKSGLVPPEVLTGFQAQLEFASAEDAPVRLARQLVQNGWLTSYQAKKLLAGATLGFFLGGYRLLRPLGEGGMGKVYLAVDDDEHRVAIKVLPPARHLRKKMPCGGFAGRWISPGAVLTRTWLARSRSATKVTCTSWSWSTSPVKSLYQLVKSDQVGPLRVPDAARLFLKLIDGLEAAHDVGLVHRDIKPSNIMITPEGDVKLLDMGLARALDDETGLTRANTVLGTLDYASPEQLTRRHQGRRAQRSLQCGLHALFRAGRQSPL